MGTINTFEELEAWKCCRALKLFVSRQILPVLLANKEFDLADNLKRAARSTTNNIAEGYGRFHYRDNYRFCSMSRGSLYEVPDGLIGANDDGLIDDSLLQEGRDLFEHALKVLNGYMAYLKRSAESPNNPVTQ